MSDAPADVSLGTLLDRLRRGDEGAAEQIFHTYEPYLRMVVRRQLSAKYRAKFDSMDIVQSVWADTLKGFRETTWQFSDAAHLRAFLVKATRNRFLDRYRQHRTAVEHSRPLEDTDTARPGKRQPSPSEEAEASDLWEQMLTLCPPAHHELLRLKREGLSLTEIAARTGLHPSSVRRILYELARKLAAQRGSGPSSPDAPC
jgi:RNA polymerase sigma-70 factor (ECF subfamily)